MKYAQIREYDVANGEGVRTSFFVSGCTHKCYNCFNEEYQDFNYGKEWTDETTRQVIKYLDKPHVSGLSILGGEPMQNAKELVPILKEIKAKMRKDQTIWLWSGYVIEDILKDKDKTALLSFVDVLVDGKYIEAKKDLNLRFRGSSNQRIIDIKKKKILK